MLKRLLILAGLLIAVNCSAQDVPKPARQWELGADYLLIDPPQPTSTGNKVEVVEVFSYACPHCAHFQPYIDELKSRLPKNAQLVLIPAVFNAQWEPFARAFYTAQILGVLEKSHQAMFDAMHRDHIPMNSMDAIGAFYAKFGADPGNFLSTATSFVVDGKMSHGNDLVRDYHVDSTPTLVINGKYRITASNEHNIGFPEMIQIALFLVDQEKNKMGAAKK